MSDFVLNEEESSVIREILGYLNFASGNSDPHFSELWNRLFAALKKRDLKPIWSFSIEVLRANLTELSKTNDAFRQSERAESVLTLLRDQILPGYLDFHRDILFHQTQEFLFNPFFLARLCEIILRQPLPWKEEKSLTDDILAQVNDFLGYRPIPILEGEEKHEPNPHEWVAPVPLYLAKAGSAEGRYRLLIEKTIEILRSTDPVLLRDAWFDPEKLLELAVDPKAFDFDHPVNRRPNYYFGTWDPHLIDKNGYYRRFIIHQVTLEGILQRVEMGGKSLNGDPKNNDPTAPSEPIAEDELLYEAAAVLAGTILMGSGITGDHVQTHDSSVSLTNLMPIIASYRDRFYELLIQRVPAKMRPRLEEEARRLFQPFGGARQDLNKRLAKRRADQLQRLHLARVFARMGYYEAAARQAQIISVASARILCQIECLLTEGYMLADKGDYKGGEKLLSRIEDLIHRGIACGALPDPWTLLGFGAQYSLFPSADNTVHDHRIDDLINLLVDVFDLYSRLLKEAAAKGDGDRQADISDKMSDLAGWWDQYGSMTVSSVEGFSGQAIWESATKVAQALAVWHKAGIAAGDVSFWSRHVQRFNSPKAFVLLGEALLDQKDPIASMSLLMFWLSNAETIPLTENDYSFHGITFRWMEDLWEERSDKKRRRGTNKNDGIPSTKVLPSEEYRRRWTLTKTFLERLEANAGIYGEIPVLEVDPDLLRPRRVRPGAPPDRDPSDESHSDFNSEIDLASLEEFRKFVETHTGQEQIEGHRHFIDNILGRPNFKLYELINAPWVEEEANKDPGFREFVEQELDTSDIPEFIEFLRKNLIRLILRQERTVGGDSNAEDLSGDIALLFRVIDLIQERTGLNMVERFFSQSYKNEEAAETSDVNYQRYLSDFLTPAQWARLQREVVNPEETEFDIPIPSFLGDKDDEDFDEDDDEDEDGGFFDADYDGDEEDEDDDEEDEDADIGIDPTFQAAYDNMIFKDSAEDGIDDEMMESGANPFFGSDDELADETDRINDRLAFIFSLMKLWKYAAGKSPLLARQGPTPTEISETQRMVGEWIAQAKEFQKKLEELLVMTGNYRIPNPSGTSESLLEYDQQHGTKEILLDRIIRTEVEVNDTILFLQAVCGITGENITVGGIAPAKSAAKPIWGGRGDGPVWYASVSRVLAAMIHSDVLSVRRSWQPMLARLERETLLYIPTSRNGDPEAIVHCRCLQQVILRLLEYAPRLGLLTETFALLRTVQKMEQIRPDGPGAITEFDRIFETATRSVARLISDSSRKWRIRQHDHSFSNGDEALVFYTERAVDVLLGCWLSHSQHIRISSVEAIMNASMWERVKTFIQKYGSDIFTQQFLSFRNLRAILHQGVENYLKSLMKIHRDGDDLETGELLVSDLAENRFPLSDAVACLEMIFECVAENYSEYIDYNSTTTHSDHGEKLYMLLDMFRVLTQYERVAWNLKPVYWVHNTLIRNDRLLAASLWEASIGKKSVNAAEENLKNYQKLSARYGVWLPSIYERLAERFVRPLQIDRMCGLVAEAIQDAQKRRPSEAFKKLDGMIDYFASEQTGIGFEIPEWLSALQDEVIRFQDNVKEGDSDAESGSDSRGERLEDAFNPAPVVEPILLSRTDLERQISWCLKNISFREQ